MSGKVDKVLSKLEKIRRLNEEIVVCLIEDPKCLDTFSHSASKRYAYQQAIAYFETKRIDSQTDGPKMANRRTSLALYVAIDEWRDATCEKEDEAAAQITRLVLETGISELKLIPEDIKATAFKIIRNYLTKMGGLYS